MVFVSLGKEFIKEVVEQCVSRLIVLGVRRPRKGCLTWPLHEDFHGWIGLNTETHRGDGTMIVNPNVGVRCDRIHQIITAVDGRKYTTYEPPTIIRGLGYLMPQHTYVPFIFHKKSPIESVADELCAAVEQYGMPYMRAKANLEAIIKGLDCLPRQAGWEESGERLLSAYYLLGDRDAIGRLIHQRSEEGKKKRVSLERFIKFSERFLKYVNQQGHESPKNRDTA